MRIPPHRVLRRPPNLTHEGSGDGYAVGSPRRGARAAESDGLENRCGASHRGFESHPLRQMQNAPSLTRRGVLHVSTRDRVAGSTEYEPDQPVQPWNIDTTVRSTNEPSVAQSVRPDATQAGMIDA